MCRFNTGVYKDKSAVFEKEVLERCSASVKIGITDLNKMNNDTEYLSNWLRDYNVQYFRANNAACLARLSESINLRVVEMTNFPWCSEKELNIFLEIRSLHSLCITFKKFEKTVKKVVNKGAENEVK